MRFFLTHIKEHTDEEDRKSHFQKAERNFLWQHDVNRLAYAEIAEERN